MAKETIRDFYGRVEGTLEEQGGRVVARDFYGKVLGTYDERDGYTRDFYGRIVSSGNSTAGLIAKDAAEKNK